MLKCQQQQQQVQQTTTVECQDSPLLLRRIRSLEGNSHSYVCSAVSQTEIGNSHLGEAAGKSSLNSALPPPNGTPTQPQARFSPAWKNRRSMPTIPSGDLPSQAASLNGPPPRRSNSQSSKRASKVLPTIIDRRPSSGCYDSSSEESSSPTTTASKVLVPCRSSRHQHSSQNQATFELCTLPHLPVAAPVSTLQDVNESLDSVSCSDSLGDESSQGSMVMQVSSATGQLEQVPKSHHSVKKQSSTSYANFTWQNSSSHTNGKNQPDLATLNRANAVILRLAQEPCCSPTVYRMRKANSIILNSIETTV